MSNIVQTGQGSFTATSQDLYDYKNELMLEDREVTLKMEKPRKKGANAVDFPITGYFHPVLNKWVGKVLRVLPDGTYEWKRFRFNGVKKFNLRNVEEAYEFFIWKNSAFFKGSVMQQKTGNLRNLLVEYDPQVEASTLIENRVIAHDMEGIILNWNDQQVKDFGAVYKMNPVHNSVITIKSMILNKLNNDPKEVRKHYESYETYTQYLVELRKAQFVHLITIDPQQGWKYRDTILGADEDACVARLKRDTSLFMMLKSDVEQSAPGSVLKSTSPLSSFKEAEKRKEVFTPDAKEIQSQINSAVSDALADFKNSIMKDFDLTPKGKNPMPEPEGIKAQLESESDNFEDPEDVSGFAEDGEEVAVVNPPAKKAPAKTNKK